jgi:carboxylesterase
LVGVSFGGALALHAAAVHPEDVTALVLINPYVRDPRLAVTPVARFLLPSVKGIGNDIKKPGQDELCNDRLALGALASMSAFHRKVRSEMPSVRAPLLVFSAADDHTVKPANSSLVMERVGSERKELVRLTNSYHVATLDYDADLICQRTLAFLRSTTTSSA